MDSGTRQFILDLMRQHDNMTIATQRDDGFPQATTVAFANDGMTIYFAAARESQKVRNINRSNKVSLAINKDYADWRKIKGLSMGATAEVITDEKEAAHALDCLAKKFAGYADMLRSFDPEEMALVKVRPKVISVLNYEQEFGHTELVEV